MTFLFLLLNFNSTQDNKRLTHLWVTGDLGCETRGAELFPQLLNKHFELLLQSSLVKLGTSVPPVVGPGAGLLDSVLHVTISSGDTAFNLDISHL